jgi:hypothetical protein
MTNEGQQPKHQLIITIVLINGCFHNGPVICPRLVIIAQGRLYWPEATPRAIHVVTFCFEIYRCLALKYQDKLPGDMLHLMTLNEVDTRI